MLIQGTETILSAITRVQQDASWHMHDGDHMFGHSWGWGAGLVHILPWLLILVAIMVSTLVLARKLGRRKDR